MDEFVADIDGSGPEIEVEIAARPHEVLGIPARTIFNIEIAPEDLHLVPREGQRWPPQACRGDMYVVPPSGV